MTTEVGSDNFLFFNTCVLKETCPLPYPKRFEAAVDFVTNPHPSGFIVVLASSIFKRLL